MTCSMQQRKVFWMGIKPGTAPGAAPHTCTCSFIEASFTLTIQRSGAIYWPSNIDYL